LSINAPFCIERCSLWVFTCGGAIGVKEPAFARGMVLAKPGYPKAYLRLQELFFYFKESITDSINHFCEFRCSGSQNLVENFWLDL